LQLSAPLLVNFQEHQADRLPGILLKYTQSEALSLGLRDGQIVQGLLTEGMDKMILSNPQPSFQHNSSGEPAYHSASFWFLVRFSPYGVYLKAVPYSRVTSLSAPGERLDIDMQTLQVEENNPKNGYLQLSTLIQPNYDVRKFGWASILQLLSRIALPHYKNILENSVIVREPVDASLIFHVLKNSGLFADDIYKKYTNLKELLRQLLNYSDSELDFQGIRRDMLESILHHITSSQHEAAYSRLSGEIFYRFSILWEDHIPVDVLLYRNSSRDTAENQYCIDLLIGAEQDNDIQISCILGDNFNLSVSIWVPDKNIAHMMSAKKYELSKRLNEHGIHLATCSVFDYRKPSANKTDYDQIQSFTMNIDK
jgi:hypothetical protein